MADLLCELFVGSTSLPDQDVDSFMIASCCKSAFPIFATCSAQEYEWFQSSQVGDEINWWKCKDKVETPIAAPHAPPPTFP